MLPTVTTPIGPGTVIGQNDGQLFIALAVANLTEEARAALRPGVGKVIHRWFPAEKVSEK